MTIDSMDDFYPRPPGGGRPRFHQRRFHGQLISIHALRVEGDVLSGDEDQRFVISIHALRVEGDHHYG